MSAAGLGELPTAEDGVVAGWEALPFGFLLLVVGVLVVANAWAVADAKMAVTAAAREGARAFVEAEHAGQAHADAVAAAGAALQGHGRPAATVTVDGAFERCAVVVVRVAYTVPAVSVPWVGGFGQGIRTTSAHAEIVDPLRSGVDGAAGTGGAVICDV